MTPNNGVTVMSDHNRLDKALNSIQHSEIPPTTERLHNDWNRGAYTGQRSVLLRQNQGLPDVVCSQEQFSGPGGNVRRAESFLRGDRHPQGSSSDEYSELEGLDLDVAADKSGPLTAIAYALGIMLSAALWIWVG